MASAPEPPTFFRLKIPLLLAIFAAIFLGSVVAAFIYSQLPTRFKYRLTLKIDANGTVYSGSSVIETSWYPGLKIGHTYFGNAWNAQTRGEAVAVDLGNIGTLFALLTGPATPEAGGRNGDFFYSADPEIIPLEAFALEKKPGILTRDFLNAISRHSDPVDLPLDQLPMLVRFKDLSDPRSVERVDPDDLPASFGPGTRILAATLTITHDPLTTGLESKLPWLHPENAASLDAEFRSSTGLTRNLATIEFKAPLKE
jgi:hypothetical protein